jgi:hypothetical protein
MTFQLIYDCINDLFALMINEVTRDIQDGIPWYMIFTDDVVLVDENMTGVGQKLELW